MGKKMTITLIVVCSIIAVLLSMILIFCLYKNISFGSFKYHVGVSKKLIEKKEYDYVNNISIKTNMSDVNIKKSTDGKVKVELYSNHIKEYSINNESGELKIYLSDNKRWFNFFRNKIANIVIYLPDGYDKEITINSNTGDINIENFSLCTVNAFLDYGNIKVDNLDTLKASLNTGDIKVGTVGDLVISARTGDVKVENVNNYLDINTNIGDIKLERVTLNNNSNIKSNIGDIKIKSLNGRYVNANSRVGEVKVENNNRFSDIELTITSDVGEIKVYNEK